jgi:uncharacterized protein
LIEEWKPGAKRAGLSGDAATRVPRGLGASRRCARRKSGQDFHGPLKTWHTAAMEVSALWRYPVKSMLGEACREVALGADGVPGDRAFAVRGDDGRPGSAKRIDALFAFRARYDGEWPEIVLPGGRRMRGDDPAIHGALSTALGMPVKLVREGDAPYFDAEPIHLVTSAALDWLRARLPRSRVDERRFRPNLVISCEARGQPELSWIGRTLRVGGATLRISASTERCRMTTLAQADLPSDPSVLRAIAQHANVQFGVYAEVVEPGRVAVGDTATLA